MAVATYTKSGTKSSTPAKLDKKVFGVEVSSHELLKQAYLAYLAEGRAVTAKTKKRGEVSGGGQKPWRQKGTGRARFGSSRNPIWRGGGVAFGPTGNENYTKKLSDRSKKTALRQALSLAAQADKIIVIEDLIVASGKTRDVNKLLTKIGVAGTVLVAVDNKDDKLSQAVRNLPNIKLIQANYLTVFDILNADTIVINKKSLDIINSWLSANSLQLSAKATERRAL